MKKIVLFLGICLSLHSCFDFADSAWKYGGGYSIGDGFVFRTPSGFRLKDDTIYAPKGNAIAVVEQLKWRIDNTYILTIHALNDTTRGFYYNK